MPVDEEAEYTAGHQQGGGHDQEDRPNLTGIGLKVYKFIFAIVTFAPPPPPSMYFYLLT